MSTMYTNVYQKYSKKVFVNKLYRKLGILVYLVYIRGGEKLERFDMDVISQAGRKTFCGGQFKDKLIQSICHDGTRYYVGFSWMHDDRMSTIAVMKDLKFTTKSVIRGGDLLLSHCNDMEYNPEDGKIWVATGTNRIVKVTPETMAVYSVRILETEAWSIARYPGGSWFVFDGNNAWRYSRDFVIRELIWRDCTADIRTHAKDGYWQGAIMVEDRPFLIYSVKGDKPDHYLWTLLYSPGEIYWCRGDREVEGGVVVDGNMEFVYGQLHFGGAYWDMNSEMKTVYKSFSGVKAASGNITLDMKDVMPDGYQMTAANVNFKKGSQWRTVPYMNGTKITMQILKVTEQRVVLKASEDFGTVPVQVTGFCRKA